MQAAPPTHRRAAGQGWIYGWRVAGLEIRFFCIWQLFPEWFLKRVNISWFLKAGIEASDVYETIRCHARSEGRNKLELRLWTWKEK